MFQAEIELGAAWQDLVGFLSELHALRIDLTIEDPHGRKSAFCGGRHSARASAGPGSCPADDGRPEPVAGTSMTTNLIPVFTVAAVAFVGSLAASGNEDGKTTATTLNRDADHKDKRRNRGYD
jgi:hypothetical protein